jgi:hypothetical protein
MLEVCEASLEGVARRVPKWRRESRKELESAACHLAIAFNQFTIFYQ